MPGPEQCPIDLWTSGFRRRYRCPDAVLKFSKYAECGVASYWLVDPAEPSVVAYDLVEGAYVEVAGGVGAESVRLRRPFDVTLTAERLVTD